MKSKLLLEENGSKTFALVFDKDEEIKQPLLTLAAEHGLSAAQVTAIGAFSDVTLGYFDRKTNRYLEIRVREQVEVLSFTGNIVQKDNEPKLHAHVVIGKSDGTAHGGHFLRGTVWPTLEMIVSETPRHLRRVHDAETGLPLIDVAA
ncbi:MAG TPA: PPC domain-containing DNA-binding protein [Terriglobales bacterium]|nr:PPC domain-containing DNA-binding protein [Terriglobales bacterium]